jgi:hypothetical protein
MSTIETIFEDFCNKYRLRFSPKNKYKAKIITPFGGLDSDPITFIVEQIDENKFVLDDGLSIFRFFDQNFYDPSDNAMDIAYGILKQYNVNESQYHFIKNIDLSSSYWQEEILDYITALVRLQDLTFLKREVVFKEFVEIVREYVKNHFKPKHMYISQGIPKYDSDNLYPIDISLTNTEKNYINIYVISNQGRLTESTISMMYYRYEVQDSNFYNISIFDNFDKFFKMAKFKRLSALTDKILADFGDHSKKIMMEEIEKRL